MNPLNARYQMAKQAYARGEYAQAIGLCDQLLDRMGARDDLLNIKAVSWLALGQLEAAEESIRQALKLNPHVAGMHLNAAGIYKGLCHNKQLKRHALEAVRLAPRAAPVLYQAALLFRDCGDYSQALRLIERCLRFQPGLSLAWHLKGSALIDLGDLEAAQQALEKALSLEPGNARALSALVKLRDDCLADTETVAILERIRSGDASASDRGTATFCLAHMHHREGQYDSAFELYRQANEIIASAKPFDLDAWEQRIEKITQTTGEPGGFTAPKGTAGSNLVFIIGMPRSGTSLCEQVLSAHSGILACGELATMQSIESSLERRGIDPYRLEPEHESRPRELELASVHYLSALPKEHQKYQRVTDKAPMNFERIGLIHQLFPGARFLYCTRHPLDTILSCFMQNFHAGLDFAFDLEQITMVYIAHVRLMTHWSNLLPRHIHTLDYVSFVSNLEVEARAMAEFLQLEFEPAMLAPHLQQRAVMTASNLQVRQPVYTSSINKWKNYRQQLDGVIDLLHKHGVLEKGPDPI